MPAFITCWVQIRWLNWLAQQWDSDELVPFPNLAALSDKIDDSEPWEPTFPDRYAPEDLARGGTGGFRQLEITTGSAGNANEATSDAATIATDLRIRRAAESEAAVTAAVAAAARPPQAPCACFHHVLGPNPVVELVGATVGL